MVLPPNLPPSLVTLAERLFAARKRHYYWLVLVGLV